MTAWPEIERLIERRRGKSYPDNVIKWKWVRRAADNAMFYGVGVRLDGGLHNPNDYPEDEVRDAIEAVLVRRHARDSAAAKKAAQRREKRVRETAAKLLKGMKVGPRKNCASCGKGLIDAVSIERGIGPECWERVLQIVEASRRAEAAA
jgi:hypothetical protein